MGYGFSRRLLVAGAAVWLFCIGVDRLFADYPIIRDLDSSDVLYQQIQQDIEQFNTRGTRAAPMLTLYRYHIKSDQNLLSISARLTLPYSSLATLNRLDSPTIPESVRTLLVPNIPGMFIPVHPDSAFEQRLESDHAVRAVGTSTEIVHVVEDGASTEFEFVPGADFTQDERLSFFETPFKSPITHGLITSFFGMRTDPFTGLFSFHGGIDIEAPIGTDVHASSDGTVSLISRDHEYGNFIVLQHSGGYQTLYAHLSKILVQLNQKVTSGMIIGKVGITGMSTGPHLHFEIRYHGKAVDPLRFLTVNQ